MGGPFWEDHLRTKTGKNPFRRVRGSRGPEDKLGAECRGLCCHLLALPGTAGSGPGPLMHPGSVPASQEGPCTLGGSLYPGSAQEAPEGAADSPSTLPSHRRPSHGELSLSPPQLSLPHRTSASHPWGYRTKKLRSCPRWVLSPAGRWVQAGPSCPGSGLRFSRRDRPEPGSPLPGWWVPGAMVSGECCAVVSQLTLPTAPSSCTGSPWSLGCANRTAR